MLTRQLQYLLNKIYEITEIFLCTFRENIKNRLIDLHKLWFFALLSTCAARLYVLSLY